MNIPYRDFENLFRTSYGGGTPPSKIPRIFNVSVELPNTEYSQVLPEGTKQFQLKVRGGNAKVILYFNQEEAETSHFTVERGNRFIQSGLLLEIPTTIYFKSDNENQVIEIVVWG